MMQRVRRGGEGGEESFCTHPGYIHLPPLFYRLPIPPWMQSGNGTTRGGREKRGGQEFYYTYWRKKAGNGRGKGSSKFVRYCFVRLEALEYKNCYGHKKNESLFRALFTTKKAQKARKCRTSLQGFFGPCLRPANQAKEPQVALTTSLYWKRLPCRPSTSHRAQRERFFFLHEFSQPAAPAQ